MTNIDDQPLGVYLFNILNSLHIHNQLINGVRARDPSAPSFDESTRDGTRALESIAPCRALELSMVQRDSAPDAPAAKRMCSKALISHGCAFAQSPIVIM